MKTIGYIEVKELPGISSDNGDNGYDNIHYSEAGIYWLQNMYVGSFAVVNGEVDAFAVYIITCSKEVLGLKGEPPTTMPQTLLPGEILVKPELPQELMHEVISTDIFLKALALAMNQNTNNSVMEEILK